MDFTDCPLENLGPGHEIVRFCLFYERWRRGEVDNSEAYYSSLKSVSLHMTCPDGFYGDGMNSAGFLKIVNTSSFKKIALVCWLKLSNAVWCMCRTRLLCEILMVRQKIMCLVSCRLGRSIVSTHYSNRTQAIIGYNTCAHDNAKNFE